MAGEAVVGALRVILGMDTAQFEDGVRGAAATLQGFHSNLKKIAGALTAAFALGGITVAIKNTIDSLEELNKASQKIGIPVEQLSELKYAADLADVSFEALTTSMAKLAKNMVAVASGSGGDAAAAFRALGIDVNKAGGGLKTTGELLGDVAEEFAKLEDGAAKTALAIAIFGRAGAQMIPLLNAGRKGLEESADEARKFGLVISTETAKKAEEFNDNLERLRSALSGALIQATAQSIDAMKDLSSTMVAVAKDGDLVSVMATVVGGGLRTLGIIAIGTGGAFAQMGRDWKLLVDLASKLNAPFKESIDAFKEWQSASRAATAQNDLLIERLMGFSRESKLAASEWEGLYTTVNNNPLKAAPVLEASDAVAKFIETTTASVQVMRAEVAMFGQSEGAIAKRKFELQALAVVQKDGAKAGEAQLNALKAFADEIGRLTNIQTAQNQAKQFQDSIRNIGLQARETSGEFTGTLAPGFIQAAQSLKVIKEDGSNLSAVLSLSTQQAKELNAALLGLEGAKMTQEFLTPWQQYEAQLERINLLLREKAIKHEVAEAAGTKAALKVAQAYGEAAQGIVSPMADAFKSLASINKKYAGAAKAAAIAEALINTYVAATKALAQGGVLGFATAAAVTAAGLANVAKISATEFATGGSFKVGGGIGGIDSELITFKATPGEMVDIRKPGATGGGLQEITLTGISGRDLFTGDMLRDLFASLNAGMADGYKLKVAT